MKATEDSIKSLMFKMINLAKEQRAALDAGDIDEYLSIKEEIEQTRKDLQERRQHLDDADSWDEYIAGRNRELSDMINTFTATWHSLTWQLQKIVDYQNETLKTRRKYGTRIGLEPKEGPHPIACGVMEIMTEDSSFPDLPMQRATFPRLEKGVLQMLGQTTAAAVAAGSDLSGEEIRRIHCVLCKGRPADS